MRLILICSKKAVNATKSRGTIDAAMDWLLEHQNDPDIDIPAAAAAVDEDMETSAVFSAARHFGMQRASFLFARDELLRERTWLDTFSPEETERQRLANIVLFEVTLACLETL